MFTRFREPVNSLTHLAGALFTMIALLWLLTITAGDKGLMFVVFVYGISTIAGFSASGIMHLYWGDQKWLKWLIQLDHAAIYIMIAGNFTPILYLYLEGSLRLWSMAGIWVIAFVGVVYKMLYWQAGSHISTLLYVLMGWSGLLLSPFILPQLPFIAIWLIFSGGIMYSVGAIIFALKRPNLNQRWGHHEIWHLFVLAGFGLHFITLLILLP